MKRSDLTTLLVLATVDVAGVDAWGVLTASFPPKLVAAAFEREVRRDNLDYGVCLERPWLTAKGRAALSEPLSHAPTRPGSNALLDASHNGLS